MSYKIGYFVWPEPQRAKRRVLVSAAAEAKLTDEQIEALLTRSAPGQNMSDVNRAARPHLGVEFWPG